MVLHKEVTSTVCTSVAILATIIRLFVRRLVYWFDDVCALLSMISVITQMVIIISIEASSFASYYVLIGTMFYSTVWFARLSILLTIIRIGPNFKRSRYLFGAMVVFLILFGILIGQVIWVCEAQQIKSNTGHICRPAKQIAILKLASDVFADLVLLTSSLRLFLVIQDKALRIRLSCLFSTCVLTTVLSLVNSSFILTTDGPKVIIISLVEDSVSLIVANTPVLSTVLSQVGEHTSHEASRGGVTSIINFVHPTDTQVSGTTLLETGPIPVPTVMTSSIIKTPPADVMT